MEDGVWLQFGQGVGSKGRGRMVRRTMYEWPQLGERG
jgi:hypothetical protein